MKIKMNQKGFTLIELLIVVAIIAILAAIAIPQFSAYRVRGYNASANSDSRNLATSQEALYADTQGYGKIAAAALPGTTPACDATKVRVTGPQNPATSAVSGAYLFNERGSVGFSISNNVVMGAVGSAAGTPPCNSYIIVAKHSSGDACYGRDSDSTASYRAKHSGGAVALLDTDFPAATYGTDQLTAQTSGACTSFTGQ